MPFLHTFTWEIRHVFSHLWHYFSLALKSKHNVAPTLLSYHQLFPQIFVFLELAVSPLYQPIPNEASHMFFPLEVQICFIQIPVPTFIQKTNINWVTPLAKLF